MKTNSPNETPETNPFYLASQAEYVLSAIDEGHPGRNALWAVLAASNGRLSEILETVRAEDAPQTWEGLVEPLEAASMDLYHALALFEAIHGDEDDPAMEAVGTLLRMAKGGIDEMCNAMIPRVRPDPRSAGAVEPKRDDKAVINRSHARKVVPA